MKDLKLEIFATNALKEYAKTAIANLLPQLEPFIGKKVFLTNGDKAKGFNPTYLKPIPFEGIFVTAQTYVRAEYGHLELFVKFCVNGGSYEDKTNFTKYIDRTYYLGECRDKQKIDSLDTIEHIIETHHLNNIVDLETELKKIAEYKELQAKANVIKDTIKVSAEYYKYL